jgi:hypothetical protein
MKLKLVVLAGVFGLLSGSSFGTSIPNRGTSSYGTQINIDTGIGASGTGFQEEVVCNPQNSDPGFVSGACSGGAAVGYDLLLAITSDALDGDSFAVTLPSFLASSTDGVGGGFSFGVLECSLNSDGSVAGNSPIMVGGTTFCTATQFFNSTSSSLVDTPLAGIAATCETDLQGLANGTDSITIPGACITKGMTFYFDETSPNTTVAPEPETLMLLGMGLLALMVVSKRRLYTTRRHLQLK